MTALAATGSEVIGTKRGKAFDDDAKPGRHSWLSLDLAEDESCIAFVEALSQLDYGTVILTIGQLSSSAGGELRGIGEMTNYFTQYVSRYCWVINEIIEHSGRELRILHLSSRASKYGSWDEHYAVAKASIEVFLRSKSRKTGGSTRTLSIAPGLIEQSGMASVFEPALVENHRSRAGGKLLNVGEVVTEIERLLRDPEVVWDGRVITLGPDYP